MKGGATRKELPVCRAEKARDVGLGKGRVDGAAAVQFYAETNPLLPLPDEMW